MKIPQFEMERRQSRWENLVKMDLSERSIRPVTSRELQGMGLLRLRLHGRPEFPRERLRRIGIELESERRSPRTARA